MFTSSMTLTLDFQGQILKKSNLRNGMADLYGIKGMWVDPCQLIDMERKGYESIEC